jgi:hypothetical protein
MTRTTKTDAELTYDALRSRLPQWDTDFNYVPLELGGHFTLTAYHESGAAEYPTSVVLVEEYKTVVQAMDFTTGELVWQADFHLSTPLELVLTTARAAAAADR